MSLVLLSSSPCIFFFFFFFFFFSFSNRNDTSATHVAASETANQFKTLLNIVKSVASHASNQQLQQSLLSVMHDLLERIFLLLATARDMISAPPNAETRRKLMALTDLISQGFNALRSALPGLKDIDLAVNTINSALSELSYDLPTGIDSEKLQQALDNMNAVASQLSQVFQKLGSASTGPTDEVPVSSIHCFFFLFPSSFSRWRC